MVNDVVSAVPERGTNVRVPEVGAPLLAKATCRAHTTGSVGGPIKHKTGSWNLDFAYPDLMVNDVEGGAREGNHLEGA
jgi:hypothetical protein